MILFWLFIAITVYACFWAIKVQKADRELMPDDEEAKTEAVLDSDYVIFEYNKVKLRMTYGEKEYFDALTRDKKRDVVRRIAKAMKPTKMTGTEIIDNLITDSDGQEKETSR